MTKQITFEELNKLAGKAYVMVYDVMYRVVREHEGKIYLGMKLNLMPPHPDEILAITKENISEYEITESKYQDPELSEECLKNKISLLDD